MKVYWQLNLQGIGPCYSESDNQGDADRILRLFVQSLQKNGHEIHNAQFTAPTDVDLTKQDSRDASVEATIAPTK